MDTKKVNWYQPCRAFRELHLSYRILFFIIVCFLALAIPGQGQKLTRVKPLEQGHSHNDYWRAHPLTDALQLGFKSVEADVFLVDGALLVGHSAKELQPGQTLETLYLAPLHAFMQHKKGLYRRPGILYLYIDFKTEGIALYEQLVPVLQKYEDMLLTPRHNQKKKGVQVILTGNYPRERVLADTNRLVYLDGKVNELAQPLDANYFPVVSANWADLFKWRGLGSIPAAEANLLTEWNKLAKQNGQKIRFWNISEANPEQTRAIWQELLKYESILVGTDHLDWLVQRLANRN